jgi:hypothetical protein
MGILSAVVLLWLAEMLLQRWICVVFGVGCDKVRARGLG